MSIQPMSRRTRNLSRRPVVEEEPDTVVSGERSVETIQDRPLDRRRVGALASPSTATMHNPGEERPLSNGQRGPRGTPIPIAARTRVAPTAMGVRPPAPSHGARECRYRSATTRARSDSDRAMPARRRPNRSWTLSGPVGPSPATAAATWWTTWHAGTTLTATSRSVARAGALIGVAIHTAIADRYPRRAILLPALILAGPPKFLLLAAFPPVWVAITGTLLFAIAIGPVNPIAGAIEYGLIPPHMRGRVFGLLGVAFTGAHRSASSPPARSPRPSTCAPPLSSGLSPTCSSCSSPSSTPRGRTWTTSPQQPPRDLRQDLP